MPAVLHPLIDTATHIMQSERIWPEAADLNWLLNVSDVSAIAAIDHARSKLVTPPILCLRAAACGVFPFGFAWQPICLSCCASEPANKLFGVTPAYIRDGRIIFAGRNETARVRRSAFIPFADRNRMLLIAKGLIVTWRVGFSVGSSLLPITKLPPRIAIISGSRTPASDGVAGKTAEAGWN